MRLAVWVLAIPAAGWMIFGVAAIFAAIWTVDGNTERWASTAFFAIVIGAVCALAASAINIARGPG